MMTELYKLLHPRHPALCEFSTVDAMRAVLEIVRTFQKVNGPGASLVVMIMDVASRVPPSKGDTQKERRAQFAAQFKPTYEGESPFYSSDAILVPEGVKEPGRPPVPFTLNRLFMSPGMKAKFGAVLLEVLQHNQDLRQGLIVAHVNEAPPLLFQEDGQVVPLPSFTFPEYGEGEAIAGCYYRRLSGLTGQWDGEVDRLLPSAPDFKHRFGVQTTDQDALMLLVLQCWDNPPEADALTWHYTTRDRVDVGELVRWLKKKGWSRAAVLLLGLVSGNDYIGKAEVTQGVGLEMLPEIIKPLMKKTPLSYKKPKTVLEALTRLHEACVVKGTARAKPFDPAADRAKCKDLVRRICFLIQYWELAPDYVCPPSDVAVKPAEPVAA